ncbi:MAG: hypothetical protein ACOX7Q_06710 [Kiritimatiellia bacterium]|jgi:hypothetical protein
MQNGFVYPEFNKGNLELRFENDTVCIYGTAQGLERLAALCLSLVKRPGQGHLHLEDDNTLLTKKSVRGAIAIFDETT